MSLPSDHREAVSDKAPGQQGLLRNLRSKALAVVDHAGLFLVLTPLMLVIGDQFPFSNFPMYSILPESTMCVRVTDGDGKLIPVQLAFSVQASILKKQMVRELQEMKAQKKIKRLSTASLETSQECGQRVLDWMLKNRPASDPALAGKMVKLEQVTYTATKGSVTERVDVLAEGIVPAPQPKP